MKSIIIGDHKNQCFLCQKYGQTEYHHCLHGSRRKFADKYGLAVHLCHRCHTELHDHGVMDRQLEALAQEAFEETYSHKRFMELSGKDYLTTVKTARWMEGVGEYICSNCGYESDYIGPFCPFCESVMTNVRLTNEGI